MEKGVSNYFELMMTSSMLHEKYYDQLQQMKKSLVGTSIAVP